MKTEIENPSAFPTPSGHAVLKSYQPGAGDYEQTVPVCMTGMTLRDYFAAKETLADFDHPEVCVSSALTQVLAGPEPTDGDMLEHLKWEAKWRAALKFMRADAMLKERLK